MNVATQELQHESAASNTEDARAKLVPLLRELNDLKRVRLAGASGSLIERTFRRAWGRIINGDDLQTVALTETARAVAAARLAGVDKHVLKQAGLSFTEQVEVLTRSFDAVTGGLDPKFSGELRKALQEDVNQETENEIVVPQFVDLLAAQPRAGATRPGKARVVLEPAENHAEHCGMVAIYAVLCASLFNASPAESFLAGLSHHLHNARLPDAGFAGDEMIGDLLGRIVTKFREAALAELPENLHQPVRQAIALTDNANTPEAKAFQAGDVFDRVLEMDWHAQSAAFTLDVALTEMDIVHPGTVQNFQLDLLRAARIMEEAPRKHL